MSIEQLIIGAILFVVLFGVMRFVAKIVAWGLILFIGVPFIFSGPVAGVDWARIVNDLRGRAVAVLGGAPKDPDAWHEGVRLTLSEGDGRCGPQAPLRLGIWNDTGRDVAMIDYQLLWRAPGHSTEVIFRNGSTDLIVPAGGSAGRCIARPEGAGLDAVYRTRVLGVGYMDRG